jgi:hypothetical protein
VWSFTTFAPAIDSVTPDVNTKFVGPSQQVTVRFNQAMDRAAVEAGFKLVLAGEPVAGGFAWGENDTVVTFAPAAKLAATSHYDVRLAKGLKGARGGETASEWASSFDTVGPPSVASTRPADGATGADRYGVNIRFTNPMDEDSLEGRVSVSGVDSAKMTQYLSPDQLNLSLNVSLSPSTSYRVAIAAGALDRYGQPLPAYSFSFTTGSRPPQISLAIPHEIATY